MKVPNLRKQIIRNFSIAGAFFVAFGVIFHYHSNQKNTVKTKIDSINAETSQIEVELSDLQSKTAEIKKYKDMWLTISQNKKNTTGIKVDEVNSKLSATAAKYSIGNTALKLSLPETMKGGIFDRKTVSVMMSTATITFVAPSDIKAMMFINDFVTSLKGYPVITSFSISKSRNYKTEDLIDISTGKLSGLLDCKIDFFWYVYKDQEKKEDTKPVKKDVENPAEAQPEKDVPTPTSGPGGLNAQTL